MTLGRLRVLAVGVALASLVTAWPVASRAQDQGGRQSASSHVVAKQVRKPWTPTPGVTFNHPLRPRRSHVINLQIRKSIESSRAGQTVRLVTWNLKSELYTRAIVNAHRRGVGVRVLMANGLAQDQAPNGSYRTIKRALSQGNKNRPPRLKSWLRTCQKSCRGRTGIVHSKFFLFSKVGPMENIVMSASANLTEVAANNQWNDLTTIVNNEKVYGNFLDVFNEMARDRPANPMFRSFRDKDLVGWFYPRLGRSDQVVDLLRPVVCRGARGDSGLHGKTTIRIAQAVFNGDRGLRIARRIKELHRQGCNVRIVYTAMARKPYDALAGVPKRHIVQDFDGDGAYDRYLHIKAIAISGHYGRDHNYHVVLNGSSNWSGMSLQSDEQGLVVRRERMTNLYSRWVNVLFLDPPRQSRLSRVMVALAPDPYVNVEMD